MSIQLKQVRYVYMPGTPYERQALHNLDLTIEPGEFIGVIGHTGSGKSTLMQLLKGLLTPTEGQALIDGINIKRDKKLGREKLRKVGLVFQYPEHQLFEETVWHDVAFGPRNMKLPEEEVQRRVEEALKFVGLDPEVYGQVSPFSLSGGQMRRVAIAGVVALEPEYLILDEPSAGLDPRGREEIFAQIKELHAQKKCTVILVSHNMEDVAALATRVLVMAQGKIVLDDTPQRIFTAHTEALRQSGVDVPPVTRLMQELSQAGLAVNTGALTMSEALKSVLSALKGEEEGA